jgi:hypothetical protein
VAKLSTLTIVSLISVVLLPLHIAGDIAFGFDKGGPGLAYVVVPVLLLLVYAALMLAERRLRYIILFLGGLVSLGMPFLHRKSGFTAAVASQPGGILFIWTLVALGVTGGLAMILSVQGMWNSRE